MIQAIAPQESLAVSTVKGLMMKVCEIARKQDDLVAGDLTRR